MGFLKKNLIEMLINLKILQQVLAPSLRFNPAGENKNNNIDQSK